jgi:hypothetical protein
MYMIRKLRGIVESLLPLSIPAAIIATSTFIPLRPLARQFLMAVLLVWLYVMALTDWLTPTAAVGKGELVRASINFEPFRKSLYALLAVAATTFVLLLVGRQKVGEAVIALLYLVPVGWSASRWGQGAALAAAVGAALNFDFFFIPPFYTLTVGSLEGWLVLVIFVMVAILVINRIQGSLTKARESEHEAILMYELSSTKQHSAEIAAYEPQNAVMKGKPDRVLPILNTWGLVGEIQIWRGGVELPADDSRLFRIFASQIGQALERTRLAEARFDTANGAPVQ